MTAPIQNSLLANAPTALVTTSPAKNMGLPYELVPVNIGRGDQVWPRIPGDPA